MAQLTAIVDKLLTNVSNKIVPEGFVADKVLTPIQVKQSSGKIGTYGKESLRVTNTLMGGNGAARRIEINTRSSNTYTIERHGLSHVVTADDFANVEQPYDARSDATMALTEMLMLDKEKALADSLTSTSTMTNNETLSGTAQFSDFANSDPIGKFLTARGEIRDAIGLPPNSVVMDWAVAEKLRYHPGILASLGFSANRAGALTVQELASAMQVERLLIAKSVYNNTNLGQTDSISAVWGKHILFFYAPSRPAKMQKTLGYDISFLGRGAQKVFRDSINNPPESEEIVVVSDYDQFLVDVTAGYLIYNAIA